MNLRKDCEGGSGAKALVVIGAIGIIAMLFLTGLVEISIPGIGGDEYSETVVRTTAHIGMVLPIQVQLTFDQDADTGINQANIDCNAKHRHYKSGGDYCPDPVLISKLTYDTLVGSVNDKKTIYTVNGNGFQAGDTSVDVPVTSLSGVSFGPAQDNYKVWTTNPGNMHEPNIGEGNHAILFVMSWTHYQRGTQIMLESASMNVNIYYKLPEYNENDHYSLNFYMNCYVPFTKYATAEDIRFEIRGYLEEGRSIWREVTKTIHEEYTWGPYLKFFGIELGIKFHRERDITVTTAIKYEWQSPRSIGINNGDEYGSHSYLYKIR